MSDDTVGRAFQDLFRIAAHANEDIISKSDDASFIGRTKKKFVESKRTF